MYHYKYAFLLLLPDSVKSVWNMTSMEIVERIVFFLDIILSCLATCHLPEIICADYQHYFSTCKCLIVIPICCHLLRKCCRIFSYHPTTWLTEHFCACWPFLAHMICCTLWNTRKVGRLFPGAFTATCKVMAVLHSADVIHHHLFLLCLVFCVVCEQWRAWSCPHCKCFVVWHCPFVIWYRDC